MMLRNFWIMTCTDTQDFRIFFSIAVLQLSSAQKYSGNYKNYSQDQIEWTPL